VSRQVHPPATGKRRTPAIPRPRLLPTLAALVCVAGALRLASGLGAAVALDAPPPVAAPVHAESAAPGIAVAQPGGGAEAAEILLTLTRREQAVEAREAALEERAESLAEAERRLTAQLDALRAAEEQLAATMTRADRAAEDDIQRLVQVYENMKPEEAARVFAEMEIQFAAGFLGRLRPEIAAPILAGLEPRQAYALSALIAGRNALVPRREDARQ
jgi:hypothetical protein